MQVRRLAYRATRSKAALQVLQDALLEIFPKEYEHAVLWADERTRNSKVRYQVVFNSELLTHIVWDLPSSKRWAKKRDLFLVTDEWERIRKEYPTGVVLYTSDAEHRTYRDPRRRRS